MAVLPGLAPVDRREPVDVATPPWSAIARLQIPESARCTAVLVGSGTAVTAAHCLFSRRLGRIVPASAIHLLFGYDRGGFVQHVRVASTSIDPAYDLAVLTLVDPVREPALAVGPGYVARGTPLMMGGYGQDRAERLLADRDCRALGTGAGPGGRAMLVHDCSGTRGTSGGPVLMRSGDTWQLAGIQVAANAGTTGGVAVPAAAIRALLARAPP